MSDEDEEEQRRRDWRAGLAIEVERQLFDESVKRTLRLLHHADTRIEDVRRALEAEALDAERKRAMLWDAFAQLS